MGVGYLLVNHSKREALRFYGLPVNTAKEIAGSPVSAAIVSWYLLRNRGDQIGFVDDTSDPPGGIDDYHDVTERVIAQLVRAGILKDDGFNSIDENEPGVGVRLLRNVWMEEG